jgi:uncharacterized protein with PIN domain
MSPYNRSEKEEEYFLKHEAEKLRAQAEVHRQAMEDEERRFLKEQHYMRCPKCGMELQEVVFRGVHIDKCFSCGGIYFDGGELDQILAGEKPDGFLARVSGIFRGGSGGSKED